MICEKCKNYYGRCSLGRKYQEDCSQFRLKEVVPPPRSLYANVKLSTLPVDMRKHLGLE